MSQIISKPWGREIILSTPDLPYSAKILEINAGSRLSLQYHDQKTETLTLVSGQANLITGPDREHLETQEMKPDQAHTLQPGTVHRLEAVADSRIFEAATPETGTTYRLEDDFQRSDETDSVRNSPNRGW